VCCCGCQAWDIFVRKLERNFDDRESNCVISAFKYTGFDPLVECCEGWERAIKRWVGGWAGGLVVT